MVVWWTMVETLKYILTVGGVDTAIKLNCWTNILFCFYAVSGDNNIITKNKQNTYSFFFYYYSLNTRQVGMYLHSIVKYELYKTTMTLLF